MPAVWTPPATAIATVISSAILLLARHPADTVEAAVIHGLGPTPLHLYTDKFTRPCGHQPHSHNATLANAVNNRKQSLLCSERPHANNLHFAHTATNDLNCHTTTYILSSRRSPECVPCATQYEKPDYYLTAHIMTLKHEHTVPATLIKY